MNFYFSDVSAFLQMGKHGFYVWLCYGVVFFIILLLALCPSWELRQLKKQYVAAQKRKQSSPAPRVVVEKGNQT